MSVKNEFYIYLKNKPKWVKGLSFDKQSRDVQQFYLWELKKIREGITVGGIKFHPWSYWHINHWHIFQDIEHEDGRLEHKEFLAKDGVDPREEIAKRLVEDIPSNVTVLAYNMGFEKGVIRKLANLFEQYSHGLMAIHDNCKDLMIPFQNKDYYHPNMKGSYSIKYVLPSLVPEFENAYKELDLIHEIKQAHFHAKEIA